MRLSYPQTRQRERVYAFAANEKDRVRRYYLQKGPCQPNTTFPWRQFGNEYHRFIFSWFKLKEHSTWLEYSISNDSAYCLYCYLFKPSCGGQSGGDSFVREGFTNWRQGLKRLREHDRDHNSIHNKCRKAVQDLMNQKQHLGVVLSRETEQSCLDYRTRLVAIIDIIILCLRQGLAFWGHDESENSLKWSNFLTILKFLAEHNEEVKKVMLDHAPRNNKLIAPNIQKDIMNAMAIETTNIILKDLGDELFSILVDESRDISIKEQMVLLIRYGVLT